MNTLKNSFFALILLTLTLAGCNCGPMPGPDAGPTPNDAGELDCFSEDEFFAAQEVCPGESAVIEVEGHPEYGGYKLTVPIGNADRCAWYTLSRAIGTNLPDPGRNGSIVEEAHGIELLAIDVEQPCKEDGDFNEVPTNEEMEILFPEHRGQVLFFNAVTNDFEDITYEVVNGGTMGFTTHLSPFYLLNTAPVIAASANEMEDTAGLVHVDFSATTDEGSNIPYNLTYSVEENGELLWEDEGVAEVDLDLAPGDHTLTLRVTDQYGEESSTITTITIDPIDIPDAGTDAGEEDAGEEDAGDIDAGTPDSGSDDAGVDGGIDEDAGVDAGPEDAGFDAGPEDPCDPNPCSEPNKGICVEMGGMATCFCDMGYHLASDMVTCTMDMCDPNPCLDPNKGQCMDVEGTPVCSCDDGYHLAADGETCTDDNCDPNPCTDPNKGVCTDDGNEASCSCDPGYHLSSDGETCTQDVCDPNPCTEPNKGECTDEGGMATCGCDVGYHLGADGETCTQDPCDPNPCGDPNKTVCTDQGGMAVCSCDPGYQDEDTNGTCEEDCATSGLDCNDPTGGTCSTSSGTATCVCNVGWSGTGCEIPPPPPTVSNIVMECEDGLNCSASGPHVVTFDYTNGTTFEVTLESQVGNPNPDECLDQASPTTCNLTAGGDRVLIKVKVCNIVDECVEAYSADIYDLV